MSEKNELKKSNKVALIALMALIAVCCIVNIIDVVKTQNVTSIVMLVYYAFIVFYAVYGYKIPHGNLLKIVVLSFSFIQFFKCFSTANTILIYNIFNGIAIIMIAFMSGRLDRLKQNNIIAVVVLVCLLVPNVIALIDNKTRTPIDELPTIEITQNQEMQSMPNPEPNAFQTFIMSVSNYSSPLLWIVIVSAYNVRYLTHKEAGLADK